MAARYVTMPGDPDFDSHAADTTVMMVPSKSMTSSLPSAASLKKWGHLEQLVQVGWGFSGEVYRAWDPQLEREVALKLWHWADESAECPHLGLQEARLLARIRHPNIVTVYGVDQKEGRIGVWMEFIRGRTLDDLLREQGPLAAREAALIGLDLCSALAAVHSLGVLHRDIKTKNVMREEGGRIVLMDFGLSQDLGLRKTGEQYLEICGTPLYMAPEVLRGEKASVQSDIYGLGVLLYHLVTESFPAEGKNLAEVHLAHVRGKSTLLRDRRAGLPEWFFRVIERALAPESADRFCSAGQMAHALSAAFRSKISGKKC